MHIKRELPVGFLSNWVWGAGIEGTSKQGYIQMCLPFYLSKEVYFDDFRKIQDWSQINDAVSN